MRSLTVSQAGTFRTDLQPDAVGQALADPASVVWLDIQDPAEEDVALLRDGFAFHPLAIEDAIRSHERPKVDAYDAQISPGHGGYYFVVFYGASYNPREDRIETQAISLFVGANYLVTVHVAPMHHVDDTLVRWRAPNSPLDQRVGGLVHTLLDAIVDDYFPLMDQLADRGEDLEDSIFVHFDQSAIQTVFGLKRDLLNLRRVVAPERDVLNVLLRRELPIFKSKDVAYLQDIYDHIVRVTDNIDTYRDLLSSALDSYLSLQSNNLNQIMKTLTAASILLMSGSLIAGIYGMNFKYMPELNQPWGYGWALGLIIVIIVILFLFFRSRKWW